MARVTFLDPQICLDVGVWTRRFAHVFVVPFATKTHSMFSTSCLLL